MIFTQPQLAHVLATYRAQVGEGLPPEEAALQLHLICEELEARDDLTLSSPAAVRRRDMVLHAWHA